MLQLDHSARPSLHRTPMQKAAGFTLIELLVVILIGGILMGMAVPAIGDLIRGQRVRSASFDVYAALTLARSEGINRNVSSGSPILMVPAGTCGTESGVAYCNWAAGWSITQGGTTIHVQSTMSDQLTIKGPTQVAFNRAGRATITGKTKFNIEADLTEMKRCVLIDSVGRPSTTSVACT